MSNKILAKLPFLFAFASACLSVAHAHSATTPPPMRWGQGHASVSTSSEYFSSQANYDSVRGSFQRLTGDNSFSHLSTSFEGRYGFTRAISAYGGFGIGYAHARDQINDKTNSNLTDVYGGANFLIWNKWIHVVSDLRGSFPVTQTKPSQTAPLTSDGVAYGDASLYVFKPFKRLTLLGNFGFHFPLEGLAKRWLYGAGIEIPFGPKFAVGGGVRGYETAINDDLTAAERQKTTTAANAGSLRFYSFDPALLEGHGWFALRPDQDLEVRLGFAKTMDGKRSAEGHSILVSLSYIFDQGSMNTRDSRKTKLRKKRNESHQEFETNEVETRTEVESFEAEDTDTDSLDETERMLENGPGGRAE